MGEHDVSATDDGTFQDIEVDHAVEHPEWEETFKTNDIGIVYLERDVEFTGEFESCHRISIAVIIIIILLFIDRIRPICLPVDEPYRSHEFNNVNPFVAGWGSINEREDVSNVLLQLQLPLVDNETCRKLVFSAGALYANYQIRDHVICAGLTCGEGIWAGDSGGPLMLPFHQNGTFPFYQIGIVSFSYHCARENVPGIFSSVQFHADWIKQQLENKTEIAGENKQAE